jgi:RNA polymerase sigma-70 factor (ECF subfamily)
MGGATSLSVNPIETIEGVASDRQELLTSEPTWRGRVGQPVRPRRARRNRRANKQLAARPGGILRPAETSQPDRPQSAAAPEVADETLLNGLRNGDIAAGDALVARYHGPLLRYLQRLAGPDLAEELHQQTWLSVLDHVGRFQPGGGGTNVSGGGGGFKAWLFRIATNKANDLWRSKGRERNAKEGLRRIIDPQLPGADAPAQRVEQNQALGRALERLPREQREALVLRYYSNMRFTEIAKVVGCPVNTALTRVHKGILKLRQLMEAA